MLKRIHAKQVFLWNITLKEQGELKKKKKLVLKIELYIEHTLQTCVSKMQAPKIRNVRMSSY